MVTSVSVGHKIDVFIPVLRSWQGFFNSNYRGYYSVVHEPGPEVSAVCVLLITLSTPVTRFMSFEYKSRPPGPMVSQLCVPLELTLTEQSFAQESRDISPVAGSGIVVSVSPIV